jgi:hypothetical protein
MKKRTLTIAAGLALMAGLLLVSGGAWANPNKEPVSGWEVTHRVIEDGKFWIDDDGVWHRRNQWVRSRWAGDIRGRSIAVLRSNYDPSTGDGDLTASLAFTGYVRGELVSATGRAAGVRSGLPGAWEVDWVWHLDDGRLIKMTEVASGAPPWAYVGEILDPPGRR